MNLWRRCQLVSALSLPKRAHTLLGQSTFAMLHPAWRAVPQRQAGDWLGRVVV